MIGVRLLDRYILRQLLVALAAATGSMVALIWMTQSLRFVEMVVDRGLSLWVFLGLTGLLVPSFFAVILPITTFVVVQFVYQRLSDDRELTVMRASGLSAWGLSRPALLLSAISVVSCLILNVWLVPYTYGLFREEQYEIRGKLAAFLLQEGVFTQLSSGLTVYVRMKEPDGLLRGILVDDARQPTSQATILAETGRLISGANGPSVLLRNGNREELDRQTGRLNMLTFEQNLVDLSSKDKSAEPRSRDASEMTLAELTNPDPRIVSVRDRSKFLVEAHRRLASPLTAFSFAVVALLSVLTGSFRRFGGVVRPAIGVISVVALLAIGLTAQSIATQYPILIPLIWLHASLPGLIGSWVLFAPHRDRPNHNRDHQNRPNQNRTS